MRIPLLAAVAGIGLIAFGERSYAQIRPGSSGKPLSSEPEPRPQTEGAHRPNGSGLSAAGATVRDGGQSPFENQVRKGSDPSANGK